MQQRRADTTFEGPGPVGESRGEEEPRAAVVTGGTGFIAAHLIQALVDKGWRVRTCGRSSRPDSLRPEVDYLSVDLTGDEPLEPLFDEMTHLFHLAGLSSSFASKDEMYRANVDGTENLMRAAVASGVQRALLMSTSSIYGKDVQLPQPVPEDVEPHPSPGYAGSKWQSEQVAWGFADKGLPLIVLRPASVYGPGAVKLVASTILDAAIERFAGLDTFAVPAEQIELRLVHSDDVVDACLHLVERDEAVGRAFNLISGVYPTNHEVAEVIAADLGLDLEFSDDPDRGLSYEERSQVRDRMLAEGMREGILLKEERVRLLKKYNPNNRLSLDALAEVGFQPRVTDIRQSIPANIRWYQDQRWII
ncbi:MAG: NAD(P)-dependent oxidoreductase [Actinomycetota bacterium]|nr:NAD(P)-dependent oxidoreductase [Actinomycetota bacterium]